MGVSVQQQKITAALRGPVPKGLVYFVIGVLCALAGGRALAQALSPTLCAAVRYAGTGLQISGAIVVVFGLLQKRTRFGRLALLKAILREIGRAWARLVALVKRRRLARREVQLLEAEGVTLADTVAVALGEPTLPDRVMALEREAKQFRQELEGVRATTTNALQQERQERREADKETERRLEDIEIGRLHIHMSGLFWVIVGVIFTGMPAEVAALLSMFVRVKGLTSGCS